MASSGWPGQWDLIRLEIPTLVVYENGLVITRCNDELWPTLCQTRVSPRDVDRLVAEVATAEGFSRDCKARSYPRMGMGPTTHFVMLLRTEEYCGGLRWFLDQPHMSSESSIAEFISTIADSYEPYHPEQVSLVLSRVACDSDDTLDHSLCQDVQDKPIWPFDFSPTLAIGECDYLERPMATAKATEAAGNNTISVFRTKEGDLFSVILRPYLPGESVRETCSMWQDNMTFWPDYDTLPFRPSDNGEPLWQFP